MSRLSPEVTGDDSSVVVSNGLDGFEQRSHVHLRASIDEIDRSLFRDSELPPRISQSEAPPSMVGTEPLVRQILGETAKLLAEAERNGMPKPVLTVVAGRVYGEKPEHWFDAAMQLHDGQGMPKPQSDGLSYAIGLVRTALKVGIRVQLVVPRDVLNHAYIVRLREQWGDAVEWPEDHDLGGVVRDINGMLQEYKWVSATGDSTFWQPDTLENLPKELRAKIDTRLAQEDAKIAGVVKRANDDPEVSAVMAMIPGYSENGSNIISEALTDDLKDIDGQNPSRQGEGRWRSTTAEAIWEIAKQLIGRWVSPRSVWQLGNGKVGVPLSEVAGMLPDHVIDGREAVTRWVKRPSKGVRLLLSAVAAGNVIDAGALRGSQPWWWRMIGRRTYIVDAGVATIPGDEPGTTKTVTNLDKSTLPADGSVVATNRVGPVTSALAVKRGILAAIERHWPPQVSEVQVASSGLLKKNAYEGRHRVQVARKRRGRRLVPELVG